jgi:Uma2 family endonuclease
MSIETDTIESLREQLRETQGERRLVLEGISWDTYLQLGAEVGNSRAIRLAYDEGTLEIMSPDYSHEKRASALANIAQTAARGSRMRWANGGIMDMKHPGFKKGVQADACFWFANEPVVRGKETIDVTVDPAPELVIEVDITSPSVRKLPFYATIGVAEVWRYRKGAVHVYHLEQGEYVEHDTSLAFPWLPAERITRVVEEFSTLGAPDALENFEVWIRQYRPADRPSARSGKQDTTDNEH